MTSRLRQQITIEPTVAETARTHTSPSTSTSSLSLLQKKQKMSLSQTYFVASEARQKLGKEASKGDHNLRRLVGHANLLDSLMLELADAEREQEAWFNQTVRKADAEEQSRQHIRWADSIPEDEEDDSDSDSDSDSEFDEDEMMTTIAPVQRIISQSSKPRIVTTEINVTDVEYEMDTDDDDFEDEEDDEEHALVRVASQSPPELISDDESDDDSAPPSPPQPSLPYSTPIFFPSSKKADSLVQSDKVMDRLIPESSAPLVASC